MRILQSAPEDKCVDAEGIVYRWMVRSGMLERYIMTTK